MPDTCIIHGLEPKVNVLTRVRNVFLLAGQDHSSTLLEVFEIFPLNVLLLFQHFDEQKIYDMVEVPLGRI